LSSLSISNQHNTLTIGNEILFMNYNLEIARFDIRRPASPYPAIIQARAVIDWEANGNRFTSACGPGLPSLEQTPLEDAHGKGWQVEIAYPLQASGLALSFIINTYETRPFLLLRLVVHNQGSRTVNLHDLWIVQAEKNSGGQVQFSAEAQPLDFFKVGWHDWCYTGLRHANQKDVTTRLKPFTGKMLFNPTTPISKKRGDFWSDNWGILTDQKTAIVTGLATQADQFGLVHANCASRPNELSLIARADGIPLDPGEEFCSEWTYIQFVDLPSLDPAADYVQTVARQMEPRILAQAPSAKWTHWYHYFQNITEQLFIANLEVIDSIHDTLPFQTVQLDDGYQSAWGDWTTCNSKFPNGLAYLADRITEKGYIPGLWLSPFVVDPRSKTAQEHPDWLVTEKNGKPINSGFFYNFFGYALDSTHPAVQDYLRDLMDTIVHKGGFKFVKTDFVYAGALPGQRHNAKMTRAQAFRKGLEIIRQGLGEDAFYLGCGCPFGPAIGIVDAMRVGPDTAPDWEPFLWSLPWIKPLIRNEVSIAALRNNIRSTLSLSTIHRRWWWNDPDCLMVRDFDTRLTEAEIISNITLVGLLGGLIINSDDLTHLHPQRRKLVSLLIPILSQDARPLDLLEREMPELYDLPMHTTAGDWHDVAIFNWGDSPAERHLDLARLGYKADQQVHIFDFWRHTYFLHTGADLALGELPSHGCHLLRVSRQEAAPSMVGDTLHVTQGGEVKNWQVKKNELHFIIMELGRKAEGEVWLWLPGEICKAMQDDRALTFRQCADKVWALQLKLDGSAKINVRWEEETL
jgi:alpha-galactosidase